jgi:hypothetical protein
MFRKWYGSDPLSLSVQKEIIRGCFDELNDVVRVVAVCIGETECLHHPVLLQMLRVKVLVELLQNLAYLIACGAAMSLL